MAPPAIRVLIADDHTFLAQALADMINRDSNMRVEAMAHNFADLMKTDSDLPVNILLLDKRLGHVDVLNRIEEVRQKFPLAKVVILTAFPDQKEAHEAIKKHCSGYIEKIASSAIILESLRKVHRGEVVVHLVGPGLEEQLEPAGLDELDKLTELEINILALLAQGNKLGGIAAQLEISEPWVKRNIAKLKMKLGVENRTELIAKAIDMGLC